MFVQGTMDVIEDKQKTKAELLQELIALRSRITELNQAEERLKYILTTSPVTIYTCEVGGNWAATFISENIRNQFAYEPNQFLEDHNFWEYYRYRLRWLCVDLAWRKKISALT